MPSFFEMLTPRYHEEQRRLARNKFAAGIAQPEIFETENFPLAELAAAYEKGYGMPYPTRQPTAPMPVSPTAPEHTQNLATNMPIELVEPRSLEESTMRTAGMQGRAGAEKDISSLQHYGQQMPRLEGFFEDVGEDVGEYDIPRSLGQFQKYAPAEPGKSYGDPYFDQRVGALLQKETGSGEVSKIAGAPGAGGSDGGSGGGDSQRDELFKQHLASYKAITGKVGRINPTIALMMGKMGSKFFESPSNVQQLQGILSPQEQQIIQKNLQYIEYHLTTQSQGTGVEDPLNIGTE